MKKSKSVQDEIAKSQQPVGEKLEAPVQLTPEQLEIVAAGFMANFAGQLFHGGTATTGLYPSMPPLNPTMPALKLY
ncbi:MAG: hypothetical protein ABI192_19950 [Bradyrhizobium sp.]